MKKILIGMLACLITQAAYAQLAVTDSASRVQATVYAGVLAGPKVAIHDGATQAFFTFRAGGTMAWSPRPWMTVFGIAGGELAQNDTVTAIGLFGIKLRPSKSLCFTLGKVASPVAELRPVPISGPAQFEPWTLSHLFGSALGAKATFAPSQDLSFVAGEFWRGTEASMEFGASYKKVSFAGYYLNQSHLYGGAVDFTVKTLRTVVMYNEKKSVGMFNVLGIPRVHGFSLYSDMGFDPLSQKMLRGEWGFMQGASKGPIKLLIAFGYAEEVRCFKGYVFVHL